MEETSRNHTWNNNYTQSLVWECYGKMNNNVQRLKANTEINIKDADVEDVNCTGGTPQ